MLPDLDGLEVTRRLRADGVRVPVLFLTARDAARGQGRRVDHRGDDYVTKPFALAESSPGSGHPARTCDGTDDGLLRFADLEMDEGAHEVRRGGNDRPAHRDRVQPAPLLMLNPRQVLSKAQILDHVWHYDFGGDANVVETYISYLRKKLERRGRPSSTPSGWSATPCGVPDEGRRCRCRRTAAACAIGHVALMALIARRRRHLLVAAVVPLRPDRPDAAVGLAAIEVAARRIRWCPGQQGRQPRPRRRRPPPRRRSGPAPRPVRRALERERGPRVPPGGPPATVTTSTSRAAHPPGVRPRATPAPRGASTRSPTTRGGPTFRVFVSRAADGDRVVVGQVLSTTDATLHQLLVIELAVTAAAIVASLLIGFWLVRIGLKPLGEVEDTAEAIAAGALDRRVPGEDRRTEVGRLARVLNTMLGRIQAAFAERDATEAQLRQSEERLRRFVADASHELRTPWPQCPPTPSSTSARGPSAPRTSVGSWPASGESARMKALVEDLFLLARLDEGRPLEQAPVALVPLVADAVSAAATVGPDWPVTLVANRPVEVLGDAGRLRQVIDNLLANVRSHTPPGTAATVTITGLAGHVRLEVADQGPGLTPDEATHIFERFYRTDRSRARSSGGSGLGLSIVGAIVAAHGGAVWAGSGPRGGAVFTVDLPSVGEPGTERDGPAVHGAVGTNGSGERPGDGARAEPPALRSS